MNRASQEKQAVASPTCSLRVRGLGKAFGASPVLDGIELDLDQGDLVTVLGPSGSGKTTLLRLLCGFERVDRGTIELGGHIVARDRELHVPPEKRGIGYVAQEGALFPHLSVQENLLFGLPPRHRRASRRKKDRRVAELLTLVGLPTSYALRSPSALSGGEQQRVSLARALAPEPEIVLLDEPFSALDAGLRAELRAQVATSLKRVNASALLVTHDQNEALSMGDRVAVLKNGRLGQIDSPETLYRFPADAEIAHFVGEAILVPGQASAGQVECCFGRLLLAPESKKETPAHGSVDVMIRPEQFRLCSPMNTYEIDHACQGSKARVEQLEYYGHDARISLRLDDGQRFTATVPGHDLPELGQSVNFFVAGGVVTFPCHS